MPNRYARRSLNHTWLRRPVLRMDELESRLAPATFTWSGQGLTPNWSNPLNWVGGVAPTGNPAKVDDLVFPAGAANFGPTNDIVNGQFNSITFSGSNYTLSGTALTLGLPALIGSGYLVGNAGTIGNKIALNMQLGASSGSDQSFSVNTGADISVTGKLSGTTGSTITKDGPGTLTFSNDNSGFTGTIRLNNSGGALVISHPLALGSVSSPTIVGFGSSLRVSNVTGTINEPLILNGLGIANDGALFNLAGTNSWNGAITLDSNIAFGAAAGTLIINGVVSDTGAGWNIVKEGPGEVRFNGANSYRGSTTVNHGILTVGNAKGLGTSGSAANGTLVRSTPTGQGQLRLDDPTGVGFTVVNEQLTLNGAGIGSLTNPGSLTNTNGNNTWAGPVILGSGSGEGSNVTVGATVGTNLTISGVVSSPNGTFQFIKQDKGRVILNNANTFTGEVLVNKGILNIRDSRALGTTTKGTTVANGAALELEVEAANPALMPRFDAQGRDLWNDSITGDPHRLLIDETLSISGRGFNNDGALRSISGINRYVANITLSGAVNTQVAIGVDQDLRPGHPTPDSSYFINDYSLTVGDPVSGKGTISGGDTIELIKRNAGHLILPIANPYTGITRIEQGWVTIQNPNALGGTFPTKSQTVQPQTFINNNAALHVRPLTVGQSLSIPENITMGGFGPAHPYEFINARGALMNLDGNNTWTGEIGLLGAAGIGVEQVIAGSTSDLVTIGSISDGKNVFNLIANGGAEEQAFLVDTGVNSGKIFADYDMFTIPDRLTVYYPPRASGGTKLLDTGYVPGSKVVQVNYGPGASTTLELVMNEGGNPDGGTAWTLSVIIPTNGGSIVKFGSKRLNIQGDGSYTGDNEIREGTLRAQHDTAFGLFGSGTATSQQKYTDSKTTVSAGAIVELTNTIANLNGGITAGLNVWNEQLILNNAAQQVAVAGSGGTFTLTYNGASTAPIPISATAASVQSQLNALATIVADVGAVTVTRSGNVFTIVFGTMLTRDAQLLTATAAGGAEVSVSGGNASLVNLTQDTAWRSGVTLNQSSRIAVGKNSRLALLGDIDDFSNKSAGGSQLVKRGTGTLALAGNNSFRGTTAIDQGVVVAMSSTSFGATSSGTIIADQAQMQLQGSITIAGEALTVQGSGPTSTSTVAPAGPHWLSLGAAPTNNGHSNLNLPTSGRVTSIVADPTDENVIYVATAGGGAWKTKNGGLTWLPLFDSTVDASAFMFGGSIAVSPTDSRVVYFATGESNGGNNDGPISGPNDNFAGTGLYRSSDQGQTWTLVAQGATNPLTGSAVTKILVSPTNPNLVFAATSTRLNMVQNGNNAAVPGIWRATITANPTTQAYTSATWLNLTADANRSAVRDATVGQAPFDAPTSGQGPPRNAGPDDDYRIRFPQTDATWSDILFVGNTLYAALGEATETGFSNTGATVNSYAIRKAVYRTTNPTSNNPNWLIGAGGADTRPTGFPIGDIAAASGPSGYIKLAGAGGTVMASVANTTDFSLQSIQRSQDGGATWTQLGAVPTNPFLASSVVSPPPPTTTNFHIGRYAHAFGANSFGEFYLGGATALFRTADQGTIWTQITPDGVGAAPANAYHAISFDSGNRLLAGTDGGVWMWDGFSYLNMNGTLAITQYNAIDVHPTQLQQAFGGAQDNGIQQYSGSLAWTRRDNNSGQNAGVVRYDQQNPLTIYAVRNGQLRKSNDGGASWAATGATAATNNYMPLVVDAVNSQRVLVGGSGLFESINGGTSFANLNAGINVTAIATATFQGPFAFDTSFPTIADVLSNTYDPNTIYVTDGTTIRVTKNRGLNWIVRALPPGGGVGTITDIAVDPSNRDVVYVTRRVTPNAAGERVFRSVNAGQTWTAISPVVAGQSPISSVWKIVIDPRTDTAYIGTDRGVFSLANARTGTTWTPFGSGLPNVQVRDLVLNQQLNTLTAATYGRGAFQLVLPDSLANSGAIRAVSGSSVWTGPITLNDDTTISTAGTQNIQNGIAAASLNIIGVIGDSGGGHDIIKIGEGTLILSGKNTYGGQTLVQQGVVQVNNPRALGQSSPVGTANTIVSAGAALELRSDLELEPISLFGNGIGFNGHFQGALRNVSNNNVYTGALTFETNTTIGVDSGTSLTIGERPGVLAGAGSITDGANVFGFDKELPGLLVLSTQNSYDGKTRVVQGALQVQHAKALGAATGTADGTIVLDGAQLQISRNSVSLVPTVVPAENLTLSGTGIFGTGAMLNVRGDATPGGSNDNTWAGPVQFTISPNFAPPSNPGSQIAVGVSELTDSLMIDTSITQDSTLTSFGLIKVGPGRLTLAQANSYTGVTNVNEGSLRVRNNGSLGPVASSEVQTIAIVGTTGTYTLAVFGNVSAAINAGDNAATVQARLEAIPTIGAGNVLVTETPGLNGKTLTVTFRGALADIDMPLIVAVPSANLSVNVQPRQTGGLGTVVANGATLELDGTNGPVSTLERLQINGDGVGTAGALGNAIGHNTYLGPVVLGSSTSVGAVEGTSLTITGLLSDPTPLQAPAPQLRKEGNGLVILPNANQYSGKTLVDEGVLRFQNALALGTVRSEVQTLHIYQQAGTFSVSFNGQTTNPINVGASATTLQNELNALATITGVGGLVSVTSATVPGGTIYTVTFNGTLASGNVNPLTVSSVVVNTTTQGSAGNSEVQTVDVVASGGFFALTFNGFTTNPIPVGSTAAVVQTALIGLNSIGGAGGTGTVAVTQAAIAGGIRYTVTFGGSLANTNVSQIVPTDLTTGQQIFVSTVSDGHGPEIQQLQILGTNGTFTLTWEGQTTAALPFNANAAFVQTALNGLSNVNAVGGTVSVNSYSVVGGQVFVVTFGGTLANRNVAAITATTTGGTTVGITTANDGPEGTSVTSGATLQIDGGITVTNEVVTIHGPGFNDQGALNNFSGNNNWATPLILGANASVGTTNPSETLTFTAPIDDQGNAFNLDIVGPGTVRYAGTVDNLYTGTTHVLNGILLLEQATGQAIVGPLNIGQSAPANAATVRNALNKQISDSVPVTVNETGLYDVNGKIEKIGDLTIDSSLVTTGPEGLLSASNVSMVGGHLLIGADGIFSFDGNLQAISTATQLALLSGDGTLLINRDNQIFTIEDGPRPSDLLIESEIQAIGSASILKDGKGRLELAPIIPYTGPTRIAQGDTQVSTKVGEIRLDGGSLSGTGTTGPITGNNGGTAIGSVQPGTPLNPAGVLSSGNVNWGPDTVYSVTLATTTPGNPAVGTDYDQLAVNGTVSLNGATLTGTFGPGITFGDRFTIITATGGVTGRFAEPFGSGVVFIEGQKFTVDYSNPNQVVLQKIRANSTVTVTSSQNPSTYGQVLTFTATIIAEPGAGPIPITSNVTFSIDGTSYSPVTITTAGTTVVVTFDPQAALGGALPPGSHVITATFNGDPLNFIPVTGTLVPDQLVEVPFIDPVLQDQQFISPNNSPGIQDSVNFSTTIQKERLATTWTMTIRNSGNAIVRTFTGNFTGTGANDAINVNWNGRDNGGAFVPDGLYSVVVSFIDDFGNTGQTAPVTVTVDNTTPTANAPLPPYPIIAPGTNSTVPMSISLGGAIADTNLTTWNMSIVNSGGTQVRAYNGTTTQTVLGFSVVWDGRNQSGVIVPDGVYTVRLTSTDKAGNTSVVATNTVVVLTVPPAMTVSTNSPTIYGSAITLTSTLSVTIPSVAPLLVGDEVQFFNGSTLLGTGTIQNLAGVYTATLTIPTLNAGTYSSIRAVYPGTNEFLPSQSTNITHIVNPKSITVTADNKTRLYGDPNPTFTYQTVGLVNGDTPAVVFNGAPNTPATIFSDVGTYPINKGTLTANSNYTMTFVPGTLTITQAPLLMDIDDKVRLVRTVNPTFTATFTGLKNGDPSTVVTGYTLGTTANFDSKVGVYPITATGTPVAKNYAITLTDGQLTIIRGPEQLVVGTGSGSLPRISRFDLKGNLITTVNVLDTGFTGGLRVAAADFDGDGLSDTVQATGPGLSNRIVIVSGSPEIAAREIYPFEASFKGGLNVSGGDVDGDGVPDLIVSPDEGGGPRIQVYRGTDFVKIADFFGIDDPNFRGGARTAVGDVNGDGYGDLVVAAGFGGGPRIAVFEGQSVSKNNPVKFFGDFFAFEQSLRNGAYVAAGDLDGDGKAEIITGGGPGGGPRVTAFSGQQLLAGNGPNQVANFFAGNVNNRGGVRLTVKDIDADGRADIVVGAGENAGSRVMIYRDSDVLGNPNPPASVLFDAFEDVLNGVFVG